MKTYIYVLVALLQACGQIGSSASVPLINGYQLQKSGKSIHLLKPSGEKITEESISQFCISKDIVYGWIDGREAYFALDTRTGRFETFSSTRDLNRYSREIGVPDLDMEHSFTFWDLKDGRKSLPTN